MTLCREGRRSYYGRDPGDRIGSSFAKLAAAFESICSLASTWEFPSAGLVKSGMHKTNEILSTYIATPFQFAFPESLNVTETVSIKMQTYIHWRLKLTNNMLTHIHIESSWIEVHNSFLSYLQAGISPCTGGNGKGGSGSGGSRSKGSILGSCIAR